MHHRIVYQVVIVSLLFLIAALSGCGDSSGNRNPNPNPTPSPSPASVAKVTFAYQQLPFVVGRSQGQGTGFELDSYSATYFIQDADGNALAEYEEEISFDAAGQAKVILEGIPDQAQAVSVLFYKQNGEFAGFAYHQLNWDTKSAQANIGADETYINNDIASLSNLQIIGAQVVKLNDSLTLGACADYCLRPNDTPVKIYVPVTLSLEGNGCLKASEGPGTYTAVKVGIETVTGTAADALADLGSTSAEILVTDSAAASISIVSPNHNNDSDLQVFLLPNKYGFKLGALEPDKPDKYTNPVYVDTTVRFTVQALYKSGSDEITIQVPSSDITWSLAGDTEAFDITSQGNITALKADSEAIITATYDGELKDTIKVQSAAVEASIGLNFIPVEYDGVTYPTAGSSAPMDIDIPMVLTVTYSNAELATPAQNITSIPGMVLGTDTNETWFIMGQGEAIATATRQADVTNNYWFDWDDGSGTKTIAGIGLARTTAVKPSRGFYEWSGGGRGPIDSFSCAVAIGSEEVMENLALELRYEDPLIYPMSGTFSVNSDKIKLTSLGTGKTRVSLIGNSPVSAVITFTSDDRTITDSIPVEFFVHNDYKFHTYSGQEAYDQKTDTFNVSLGGHGITPYIYFVQRDSSGNIVKVADSQESFASELGTITLQTGSSFAIADDEYWAYIVTRESAQIGDTDKLLFYPVNSAVIGTCNVLCVEPVSF